MPERNATPMPAPTAPPPQRLLNGVQFVMWAYAAVACTLISTPAPALALPFVCGFGGVWWLRWKYEAVS